MEGADAYRPWLLEICPASTLKHLGLSRLLSKGGGGPDYTNARRGILNELRQYGTVAIDAVPMKRAVEDSGGDAVDSIIAAFAVYRAILTGIRPNGIRSHIEGHVYV